VVRFSPDIYQIQSIRQIPEGQFGYPLYYLKDNQNLKIEIHGHTDNIGNAKDNDALSYNRAFSVKSTLEELGIDGKRINAKGFGSIMPISTNSTEEGRAKNRRTEFLILEK
jgi:outer membrane protein OmpA-like peptidoglycan-associated protein